MRTITSGLLLSISVLAVTACSGSNASSVKTSAPTPPASITETGTLTPGDTLTPASVTETTTITSATPTPLSVPPAMDGSMESRMAALEASVGSLRADYDRIMPAFASLNTTNERIQTLLDEIEQQGGKLPAKTASSTTTTTTVATMPPASAAVSAPMSKPTQPFKAAALEETRTTVITHDDGSQSILPPPGSVSKAMNVPDGVKPTKIVQTKVVETKTETSAVAPSDDVMAAMDSMAPSAAPTTSAAKGVRIGEHGSKTRVVIDLAGNAKPDVNYDLDNTEKLLLVDLPGTEWGGVKSGSPKNSAFISGWNVQGGAKGGSSVAINLKKGAKILSTEYLKAEGKDPARLVIDLGPAT